MSRPSVQDRRNVIKEFSFTNNHAYHTGTARLKLELEHAAFGTKKQKRFLALCTDLNYHSFIISSINKLQTVHQTNT